ncbi:MBL fold metallo-hydrolase [Ruegeria sp.]|uniref:MBL fold metallo-hydrolase n=1 Tax=Ruegeria sp. TaxID=1879320 RepID=UPI003B5B1D42
MKICIHRGSNEIGGNCVELHAEGASILLDLGEPLMGSEFGEEALPEVEGLTDGTNPNLLGIVISHPHMDHYGLVKLASPELPKFIGREADKLLRAASAFTPLGMNFENVHHYQDKQPFQIGPFRITPYIADHSAYDSYSFLVEAAGKTLFYSGDLRSHGWKDWAFKRLLNNPPKHVDAMLLEGTTLSRESDGSTVTEADLVDKIAAKIWDTKGIVLAGLSGQNIDRLVTFYKATLKTGRSFVADAYIAHLLHSIGRPSLPDPTSGAMRVFLPNRMKRQIVRSQCFDVVEPFRRSRIYPEEMLTNNTKLVVSFRASMADDFENVNLTRGGRLIYSMWPGYLENGSSNLRDWCAEKGVAFDILHSSGHATFDDLFRLVRAFQPRSVIPIHTLAPERFESLGAPIKHIPDNRWHPI